MESSRSCRHVVRNTLIPSDKKSEQKRPVTQKNNNMQIVGPIIINHYVFFFIVILKYIPSTALNLESSGDHLLLCLYSDILIFLNSYFTVFLVVLFMLCLSHISRTTFPFLCHHLFFFFISGLQVTIISLLNQSVTVI